MKPILSSFPESWQFSIGTVVDDAVKAFSYNNRAVLGAIRDVIAAGIRNINRFLTVLPWFVLVAAIAVLGWRVSKKWYVGLFYGGLMVFIGACGFWDHMLQTLSLVIASVAMSLLLGFPLGILVAMSRRAAAVIRPVLDLMQTLPTFVYLIPAILFFQTGRAPAFFATIIYSIVPMVRLTSHGIIYVDKEMIEAAHAFGSTKIQTLVKVQIPQALPTIMAGVNQTIMMAMSMVVTAALVGAEGLGMDIFLATNRTRMGEALLPGISIVILAVILDRLTRGIVKAGEGGEG